MELRDVENLAELARLELSLEEKQEILKDMGGILDYVKQIEKVEVPDVHPVFAQKNVWREDLPAQAGEIAAYEFSKKLIVEQFPDSQDGFLKVKKIL
jgi:aspartyl-tRNA(Asn)/glutamyl-tRNA(Gln) amidotransferase subunit C